GFAVVVEDTPLTAPEAHGVRLAGPVHLDVQTPRQRVDHARAHPVQASDRRVGAAAELPARVQLRVDHLDAGQARAALHVDRDAAARDAAAGVAHLDRAVAVQHHGDGGPVAPERFVDRVVEDLPQAVHEAAGVGGADVHAGALAHGLQAFEDLEVLCVVGGLSGCG